MDESAVVDGSTRLEVPLATGNNRFVPRYACCIVAAAAIAASVAADADARFGTPQITLAGVNGVAPGMTPGQVQRAWGIPIRLTETTGSLCRRARVSVGRVRGFALFQYGHLAALFFTSGVKTDRGIEIGSARNALIEAYGSSRLIFWPSPIDPGFHVYTRKRYRGDGRTLRFDLDHRTNRVTQIGLLSSTRSC